MTPRRGRLRLVHSTGRGRAARLHCTRTYGMNLAELRAEMRRLAARGWRTWELAYRFDCSCKDDVE